MSDHFETSRSGVTDSQGRPISRAAANTLQTAALRVRSAVVALRVWEEFFTDDDRQRLGGDIEESWQRLGTVGMWRKARGGTLEQAVIDIANESNLLDDKGAKRLRDELRISSASTNAADERPRWDAGRGEVRFGGEVIRPVRVLRNPSNIQHVLDSFESAGWPSRIDNPLGLGQEQLHQTLRSLNRGLKAIRFHAQDGAEAVVWQRV